MFAKSLIPSILQESSTLGYTRISPNKILDNLWPFAYRTTTVVHHSDEQANRMFFQINPSNGVPVYEQVARQIMFAVASGSILPGELIPSVREMARELAINPNTVARAFRDLQDQNILQTVRGTGVAVTKGAKSKCVNARTRVIRDRLRDVFSEARQSQLDDEELKEIIQSELHNSKKRQR